MSQTSYVMTVSRNGQVSIPAGARNRWDTRNVVVVDLGDRVVLRPTDDRSVKRLRGKYRGRGPATDDARKRARVEDDQRVRTR